MEEIPQIVLKGGSEVGTKLWSVTNIREERSKSGIGTVEKAKQKKNLNHSLHRIDKWDLAKGNISLWIWEL